MFPTQYYHFTCIIKTIKHDSLTAECTDTETLLLNYRTQNSNQADGMTCRHRLYFVRSKLFSKGRRNAHYSRYKIPFFLSVSEKHVISSNMFVA